MKPAPPRGSRAGTLSGARSAARVSGWGEVSLLPSWGCRSPESCSGGHCRLLGRIRDASRLSGFRPVPRQGTHEAGSVQPLGRSPPFGALPGLPAQPRLAAGLPGAPEGKEACPEPAGGSCIKSAGGAAVRASFAVSLRDREYRGKATAEDGALRSGYPMLELSAAAARAICWSSRTAKRSRHTAAWAGSQRCLSL